MTMAYDYGLWPGPMAMAYGLLLVGLGIDGIILWPMTMANDYGLRLVSIGKQAIVKSHRP